MGRRDKKERTLTYGYAVVRVGCVCGRHEVGTNSRGDVVCKSCGRPLALATGFRVFGTETDALLSRFDEDEGIRGALESHLKEMACPEEIDETERLRARVEELEEEISRLIEGHEAEISGIKEQFGEEISWLVEESNVKISRLDGERRLLRERSSALESEVAELNATMRHLRNEIERMRAVDVRSIAEEVMIYAAGVDNTLCESESLDDARERVDMRTHRLISAVGSKGMHVTFHRRGDLVGEGRMDITPIPTDDPEKDLTVQRSTRYGCSFDNDVYADVPEELSVFRHQGETT